MTADERVMTAHPTVIPRSVEVPEPGDVPHAATAAVSWDPPARGAYTRTLRLGEWISEPVTPLFESWLLTRMEDRLHTILWRAIGQRAPHRQRLVLLLPQLGIGRVAGPQPADAPVESPPRSPPQCRRPPADGSLQRAAIRARLA